MVVRLFEIGELRGVKRLMKNIPSRLVSSRLADAWGQCEHRDRMQNAQRNYSLQ